MRPVLRSLIAALTIGLIVPSVGRADNSYGEGELVVAVLDTGIRASHQEFDFGGNDDPDDQIVAWWDFTQETQPLFPEPGQRWDPRVPDPFDDNGHGTATASLVAGRNVVDEATKHPSFAPGVKLAIGRVCIAEGNCPGDIPAAIRWAVETAEADVISISISAAYPTGDWLTGVHEAAGIARDAGVLVVVSNGNGVQGVVPAPGWLRAFADSTNVLSVGASDEIFRHVVTTDPEVVARYIVRAASQSCDACYREVLGTSFSAPLVAGMAARAMAEARAHGVDADPDDIERWLKYAARDTEIPPNTEGYGVLDAQQMPLVLEQASTGTDAARPDPDVNAIYVDQIGGTVRDLASNKLDSEPRALYPTGITIDDGAGAMSGPAAYAGFKELEIYRVTLAPGETFTATAHVHNFPATAVGLRAYRGDDPVLRNRDLLAYSDFSNDAPSRLWFRSPRGGTYRIVAELNLGVGFELSPTYYTLEASATAGAEPSFEVDEYYLALATPFDNLF